MSPLSLANSVGDVAVSVSLVADEFVIVVGLTIEYVVIGVVHSCCLWK
jgi:hypothetical protein